MRKRRQHPSAGAGSVISDHAIGSLALGALLLAAAIIYVKWSSIIRMTADAHNEDAVLWLHATDVAPGDTLDGTAHVQAGMRLAIRGVIVSGAGDEQIIAGREPDWGDLITAGLLYDKEKGSDRRDFTVQIPSTARPGDVLHLELAIEYVTAERNYQGGFVNRDHAATFRLDLTVHSPAMSVLRRAGKAALAIASWIAVVLACVAGSRWYGRRRRSPSAAWLLFLLPYPVIGWLWFAMLLGHATRIHAWWFSVLGVIVWFLAFALVFRLTVHDALRRYLIRQMVIPAGPGDAYRSGAQVPLRSVAELEPAWQAAGFVVEHKGPELRLTKFDGGSAFVTVPASGSFGGGEPFEIRCAQLPLVTEIVAAASTMLGELRWQLADAGTLGGPEVSHE